MSFNFMAAVTITSWQIDGETVETVSDLTLGLRKHAEMCWVFAGAQAWESEGVSTLTDSLDG